MRRGDALLAEQRQAERPPPGRAAVGRVVEPGRPGVGVRHADGHGEVGVGEVDAARAVLPGPLHQARRRDAVEHPPRRDRAPPSWTGLLDRPGQAAVAAAGQQVLFGLVAVDGVPVGALVLVGAGAEADEDLIAPGPDAVVRRPAGEPARARGRS